MRRRAILFKFLLVVLCAFLVVPAIAQQKTASIYGSVFLPAKSQTKRQFRGRSYRNRRSQTKGRVKTTDAEAKSRYLDVLISAHPLSFKTSVKPFEKPVKIYQKNAEFAPHVIAVTPGTKVQFINQDKIYHNVFSITPGSKFNIGRRPRGQVVSKTINNVGEVKLFCDIHSHMNATILSFDTPYFIRATKEGSFRLSNLKPGIYEVQVYHPDFTLWRETIEVKPGEELRRNFRLSD